MGRINSKVGSLIARRTPRHNHDAPAAGALRLGGELPAPLAGLIETVAVDLAEVNSLLNELGRLLQPAGAAPSHAATDDAEWREARRILDEAVVQATQLRGLLAAVRELDAAATPEAVDVAMENARAADSAFRDAEFLEQTARLTRSRVLAVAAAAGQRSSRRGSPVVFGPPPR
jgi:hypothetical protein